MTQNWLIWMVLMWSFFFHVRHQTLSTRGRLWRWLWLVVFCSRVTLQDFSFVSVRLDDCFALNSWWPHCQCHPDQKPDQSLCVIFELGDGLEDFNAKEHVLAFVSLAEKCALCCDCKVSQMADRCSLIAALCSGSTECKDWSLFDPQQ